MPLGWLGRWVALISLPTTYLIIHSESMKLVERIDLLKSFKTTTAVLALVLPLQMGVAPSQSFADEQLKSRARVMLTAMFGDDCSSEYADLEDVGDKVFPVSWRETYQHDSEPAMTGLLIKLFCFAGAYNITHSWFLAGEDKRIIPLSFSRPSFDVSYETDDFEGPVKEITVDGMTSVMQLVNSKFDPKTNQLTTASYWRGIGDAASYGTWKFQKKAMVLSSYRVDASYDDKGNPKVLYQRP